MTERSCFRPLQRRRPRSSRRRNPSTDSRVSASAATRHANPRQFKPFTNQDYPCLTINHPPPPARLSIPPRTPPVSGALPRPSIPPAAGPPSVRADKRPPHPPARPAAARGAGGIWRGASVSALARRGRPPQTQATRRGGAGADGSGRGAHGGGVGGGCNGAGCVGDGRGPGGRMCKANGWKR